MREYYHKTMDGNVSAAWLRHLPVKVFGGPKLVICIPVGSKVLHNVAVTKEDGTVMSPGVKIPAVVPVQWMQAQMSLVHPLNMACVYMTQWGMYAGEARQVLTKSALRVVQDDGYVLYWDDDTLPPPMGLYTMMNYMEQHPEVGILSAVYCTRETPAEPVLYRAPTTGVMWDFAMGDHVEPTEIFSAGAGFMLVRVAAIKKAEAMLEPNEPLWADMKNNQLPGEPRDEEWGSGIVWGHDIRFCRLIAKAGYKIMVDGRVECGHLNIADQVIHKLPDNSPPKQRGLKYRGEQYWNQFWGQKGAEEMKIFGELFLNILTHVRPNSNVVEIGCGPGVLGMLLAAQGGVHWKGYDLSEVAVDQACAKFLNAYQKSVANLTDEDVAEAETIIALDLVPSLIPEDSEKLFDMVTRLGKRFIFTVSKKEDSTHVHNTMIKMAAPHNYAVSVHDGDANLHLVILQPAGSGNETETIVDPADVRRIGLRDEGSEELPQERSGDGASSGSPGGLLTGPVEGSIF